MAALLQLSVQVEERDAERELFSIDYVPPYGVLDEGEGLILKSFHLRYVLLDSCVRLGGAPVGGCDSAEVAALCRRRRLPWHPRILTRIDEGVLATAAAVTACLDSWFLDSCSPHLHG